MAEDKEAVPTVGAVARLVDERPRDIVRGLTSADICFLEPGFEAALADELRSAPDLIRLWGVWSADQRWTPSAYVEGTETGWYDGGKRNVRIHQDVAAAVADFVHRLAAWASRRAVIDAAD